MAAYGNPGPKMGAGSDAEMYEDGGPDEQKPDEQADDKHEDDQSPVQEVNASILGGKDIKPGQEFMCKLVSRHGDMAVIQYAPEKEEHEEQPPGDGESPMPGGGGDADMASMME